MSELLQCLLANITAFTLKFGDNQINLIGQLLVCSSNFQAIHQIFEGCRRVGDNRLHVADILKRFIYTNRVINLKMCFSNGGTQSGCTAKHLLEQNSGLNTAHKNQCSDLRHIDTGGQKVHGDNDLGQGFILEAFDCF